MAKRWQAVAKIIAEFSFPGEPDDSLPVAFLAGCSWDGPDLTLQDLKTLAAAALGTAAAPAAVRVRKGGRPRGKRALGIVDRRSMAWRRRCEHMAELTAALGKEALEGNPVLASKVAEVADLRTIAELTRAKSLQGEASADDVVRTSRAASLAERRLGIGERKPSRPSLADYLSGRPKAGAK